MAPPLVAVPPVGYGGTEAVLDGLARGLSHAGHDVLLYTTGDSLCPVPKAWVFDKAAGVGIGGAVTELRHVIHAYEAVAGYDVVHDHTLVGPVYRSAFPDCPSSLPTTDLSTAIYVTTTGRYRAACRSSRLPPSGVDGGEVPVAGVIHHGIDTDKFGLGTGAGGYALFLGRMSPDKGVHTAIRIARRAGVRLKIAAKLRESSPSTSTSRSGCARCSGATSSSSVRCPVPGSTSS